MNANETIIHVPVQMEKAPKKGDIYVARRKAPESRSRSHVRTNKTTAIIVAIAAPNLAAVTSGSALTTAAGAGQPTVLPNPT